MNLHQASPKTPDEFLRWNAYRDGKREFVGGQVVEMMINTTQNHYRIATRLLHAFLRNLDDTKFGMVSADFGVRTPNGIRYPDVMVHELGNGDDLATANPIFIGEILSKSTAHIDLGPKVQEYLAIASLQHYLILSQDEPTAWLWSRDKHDTFGDPAILTDRLDNLDLRGLAMAIPMADLYRAIL